MPLLHHSILSKIHHNASALAYSSVTVREATRDKSVTLDKFEKEILGKCGITNFERRGLRGAQAKQAKLTEFFVYDVSGRKFSKQFLALVHPKAKGNELRLYFKRETGFYPTAKHDWFIFKCHGNSTPFIGFMDKAKFAKLRIDLHIELDAEDEDYQKSVQTDINKKLTKGDLKDLLTNSPKQKNQVIEKTKGVFRQPRNQILKEAIKSNANYQCQIDPTHTTFVSMSGNPYVEVHHLILMALSDAFEYSLDVAPNLWCLCPNCHRQIHHGDKKAKRLLIRKMLKGRVTDLEDAKLFVTEKQLFGWYGAD